jgi:hypothetical protein
MLDFEIKSEQLPVIQVNFEEMKRALSETMQHYKGIVVTEESLSACKNTQKELAGIRVKIDTYRKDKKRELSKPISDFENQCKELISLVEQAEQPIKDGILIFDNQRREEKREAALKIIKEVSEARQLNEKYSSRLTVLDKYLNLTANPKSVREDIDQRAYILVEEQSREQQAMEVIRATIENANKTIKTPINISDIQYLINLNPPLPTIIEKINQMAEKLRAAEKNIEEAKQAAPVEAIRETPTVPVIKEPVVNPQVDEPLYFIELKVIGTKDQAAQLGQYLRDNNYKYTVLNKGPHQEADK